MGQTLEKEKSQDYSVLPWGKEKVPDALLSLPIKDCQFRASHNTYISDVQIGGHASIFEVLRVVSLGCRAIELDVSKGVAGNLVISHSLPNIHFTTVILLEECCHALAKWAWKYSNYPLILCIQMVGEDIGEEIKHVMRKTFGGYYLDKQVTIDTPVKELVNRVIIYPKGNPGFVSVGANSFFNAQLELEKQMVRVYPNNIYYSTNYDPRPIFQRGAQMIVMNWNNEDQNLIMYKKLIPFPIVRRVASTST